MTTFKDLKLSRQLQDAIDYLGFETPTQIQEKALPHIVKGKDVIGESATGSGKTLAFGCGVVEQAEAGKGLQAIILTPTRELAQQVKENIEDLTYQKDLRVITIYGGVSINPQIKQLERAEVVIATPGRLLDHLDRGTVDLSKVNIVVLDEADRMLDMGFIDDVEDIIAECPKKRQTLFFTATISREIKSLAKYYMKDPVSVSAKVHVDPSKLKQEYYDVSKNAKLSLLVHLLQEEKSGLCIIFCNTRRTTDFVTKNLKRNDIDATAIHGGLTQNKRSKTLDKFGKARVSVLVCTDVAARGLHINDVSHVYNYEIPNDARDYVHRIGRTARAGEKGKVINLICPHDHQNFSKVQNSYRDLNIPRKKNPDFSSVRVEAPESRGRGGPRRGHGRRGFGGSRGGSRGGRSGGRSRGSSRGDRGERSNRGPARSRSSAGRSSGRSRGGDRGGSSRGGSRSSGRGGNRSGGGRGPSRGGGRSRSR